MEIGEITVFYAVIKTLRKKIYSEDHGVHHLDKKLYGRNLSLTFKYEILKIKKFFGKISFQMFNIQCFPER